MPNPLKVTFRGMSSSDAVESDIRGRAEKLEHRFAAIQSCHVVVDAPHKHHQKGRLYAIRVGVQLPGTQLVATSNATLNHAHEDVHVAIRDAFNGVARQLRSFAQRNRHETQRHADELVPLFV
jgi:ribosome-associated translation inhibitor RaiA